MTSTSTTFALLFVASVVLTSTHALSITSFGAVANDASNAAAYANAKALNLALNAANANSTDRTVVVPHGMSFTIFNTTLTNLHSVTLSIQGTLLISTNLTEWTNISTNRNAYGVLKFEDCTDITVNGGGMVDGQGYGWWWYVILGHPDVRPKMFLFRTVSGLTVTNILARNSPSFHFDLQGVENVHFYNMSIHVDVDKQKSMLDKAGFLHEGIPTFPLNTDGIDPSGRNVLIENVYIENFDDAVAVKPTHGGGPFSNCSQNMTIRNSVVRFGVGLTIGSVPPNDQVNCVKDILFTDVEMKTPIKGLYIKSNPGNTGSALIQNITYRNIHGDGALWYPIFIGPQQQRQPGTAGTGCSFLYPLPGTKCPTNPRVTMRDITLENVSFENGLLMPGILLGNTSNPIHNLVMNNVTNTGPFVLYKDYHCYGADVVANATSPLPKCGGV